MQGRRPRHPRGEEPALSSRQERPLQSVKGTRDLLPPETAVWAAVEETARQVFGRYGYGEIRTPLLEDSELFVRTVGETTDIVGKEMYVFADRKGRRLALRPESTAAVARAYIEHGLQERPSPLRLFYIGPHFRYERPQKGRYRQFHQIGAELLGSAEPLADAELLLMLLRFLRELGFEAPSVLLNTVGDESTRREFREALRAFLEPRRSALGEDSRRRLEVNPLRILDTRDPAERALLEAAPRIEDHLSEASRAHFAAVREALDRFGVSYRVEASLVRGLDYYSDTVFEIAAGGLGAQDAIVGGGRYDRLIAGLGGPEVPGVGFAIGEDRLLEVLPEPFRRRVAPAAPLVVAAVGEVSPGEALRAAEALRDQGVATVADLAGRPPRAVLKRADRVGAPAVVLLGEAELAAGDWTIKNLADGEQRRLPESEAIADLAARYRGAGRGDR